MRVSLGVIAISSGEMRIPSGEISIHFQFISSGINRISADIISISAYRKAIPAYRKAAHALFCVAFCFTFGSRIAQEVQKAYTANKEKGSKKERSPAHGCALISCPLIK